MTLTDEPALIHPFNLALLGFELEGLQEKFDKLKRDVSSTTPIPDRLAKMHTFNSERDKDLGERIIDLFDAIKLANEKMDAISNGFIPRMNSIEQSVKDLQETLTPPDVKDLREEVAQLRSKAEKNEDEIKHLKRTSDKRHQRSVKGNLILTSPVVPARSGQRRKESQLRPSDHNESEELFEHVQGLISKKYLVNVARTDVAAFHRVKNGVILVFWNRAPWAVWGTLTKTMMKNPNPDENIYLNYQLTPKRSQLLANVRQLRKDDDIRGYRLDCNGEISVRPSEELWFKKIPSWDLSPYAEPEDQLAALKSKLAQFRAEVDSWPKFVPRRRGD